MFEFVGRKTHPFPSLIFERSEIISTLLIFPETVQEDWLAMKDLQTQTWGQCDKKNGSKPSMKFARVSQIWSVSDLKFLGVGLHFDSLDVYPTQSTSFNCGLQQLQGLFEVVGADAEASGAPPKIKIGANSTENVMFRYSWIDSTAATMLKNTLWVRGTVVCFLNFWGVPKVWTSLEKVSTSEILFSNGRKWAIVNWDFGSLSLLSGFRG